MAVPTYDQFIEPVLRYLAAHSDGALAKEVHDGAANLLGLTVEDKEELLPSGLQPAYKNRAGWAHDRLKRNGLSSSPRRGFWKLTEDGFAFVAAHPGPFTPEEVDGLASANLTKRLGGPERIRQEIPLEPKPKTEITATPDERLQAALDEIRKTVAADILEILAGVSPSFFERVVLEVLHQIGYGATKKDLQQVGGSGDGGIDGVISLDKLGLERVYVQAKRWKDNVGRPEVQAFYGALAGLRARKGVFITTSGFTPGALEFAKAAEGFVLVDGNRLAQLMIDHGVGVSLRPIHIPRLDSDFFEGE